MDKVSVKVETMADVEKLLDEAGEFAQAVLKGAQGVNPTLFALEKDGTFTHVGLVPEEGKPDAAGDYAAAKEFMKQKSKKYRALCLVSDVRLPEVPPTDALRFEVAHADGSHFDYVVPYVLKGFFKKTPAYGQMELISFSEK